MCKAHTPRSARPPSPQGRGPVLALAGVVLATAVFAAGGAGCGERGGGRVDLGPSLVERHSADLPRDPNQRVDALVRRELDAELAESPTTATWLGVHGYDDRLDDARLEAQAQRAARLRAQLADVQAIEPASLDAVHRIDRRLLLLRLEDALFDLTELHPLESNPVTYVDLASSGIEELLDDQMSPLPDRLRAIIGRLWKIRPLFDEARRNLRGGATGGPPELLVRRAIELGLEAKAFLTETLPKAVQLNDPKLMDELRAADGDAGRAFDDFLGWLQKDLLPRARGDFALGRARLMAKLRVAEGLEGVTAEALLAAGERELKAARARYDDAVKAVLAQAKPGADVNKVIEDDHPKPDELQPVTQAAAEELVKLVTDEKLVTLPTPPRPRVVDMPPQLWGFLLLDAPRPLARARESYLYVDPVDRGWPERRKQEHVRAFNHSAMRAALLHQLVGHYVAEMRNRDAPTTMEKIALAGSFVEGWPAYVERMMLEAGYGGDDPKLAVIVERQGMVRAARLVAVIKLHALGAKLEDAVKVFTEEAEMDDFQARREAERCAADPMVMLDELGRIEILKLRDDWRAAHESAPDTWLGQFHDALLAHGSPPITILREILLPAGGSPI